MLHRVSAIKSLKMNLTSNARDELFMMISLDSFVDLYTINWCIYHFGMEFIFIKPSHLADTSSKILRKSI